LRRSIEDVFRRAALNRASLDRLPFVTSKVAGNIESRKRVLNSENKKNHSDSK
jgi:hypothetical protein